ncbi:type II CAAX prenyl endopeptidase Rce1 family protein [Chloroflexota bacterium]
MLREILALLFDKLQKLRERCVNLELPRFLNPIDSKHQLILWLVIVFSLAFIEANLIIWIRGDIPSFTEEAFRNLIIFSTVMGVVEELGLRGVPKRWFGNGGLLVGTLLWIGFHQFDASPPPLYRIPGDILFGIMYVKIWRGKYWWTSFIIHPSWNIGILVWWQFVLPHFQG